MIIDTHAHLNTSQFDQDVDQVIINANNNNVNKIIVVGMDLIHNQKALMLANQYDNLYATVGIHPTSVEDEKLKDLIPLLNKNKVVALGEIGIDLYWETKNLKLQQFLFEEQIKLAITHNLPIIIHTRNSFKEAYDIVKLYKGQVRGVFHSFSSNLLDAKLAIELGFYIGISGVVTFNKAYELHEVVKEIPLNYLLLETDSPYLAPTPFRGKRNEPSYTKYVLEEVAKIKKIDKEEVARVTTLNAIKLFRLEWKKWKKSY